VISFFGIRGLGSVYYLAFALQAARFEEPDLLWSTMGLTIVISIVLHGMTVTPVMRRLDQAGTERARALPREGEGRRRGASDRGGRVAPAASPLAGEVDGRPSR
jgi:NhaP-type Na+/H+ or K+/H+ antiporter